MSALSIPNLFSPNTLIQSSQVNSNFNAISAWANGNVDNSNIGAAGVYASQIIPTNAAQATFGGALPFKFSNGLIGGLLISSGGDSTVGLTVTGATSGQTADYIDVTQSGQSAGNVFKVGFSGNVTQLGAHIFTAPGGAITGQVGISNDNNGGVNGLLFNVPTGSTNGFSFNVQGTAKARIQAGGNLQIAPLINAVSVLGNVAPAYTAAGSSVAGTWHEAFGTVSIGPGASATVTLAANAVFSSQDSYAVYATTNVNAGVGQPPANVGNISGTQFVLTNTTGNTNTYHWSARGV
jgi:hypothetical protein